MTLTNERQQFESWFTKKYPRSHWGTKKTASGEYQGGLTAQLWEVWQESLGCMANREAQPVAIGEVRLGKQDNVGNYPGARVVCLHDQADWDNFADGTKLYTAPPAPAPAVPPEKKLPELMMASYHEAIGWNACRAAMLDQPVSGDYTVQDGWIPCSEQTPVADGAYWCWFGKEKPSVIQQRVCIWNDRNHEWCDSSVTHWMPLPAAPEGGNDHNTRR